MALSSLLWRGIWSMLTTLLVICYAVNFIFCGVFHLDDGDDLYVASILFVGKGVLGFGEKVVALFLRFMGETFVFSMVLMYFLPRGGGDGVALLAMFVAGIRFFSGLVLSPVFYLVAGAIGDILHDVHNADVDKRRLRREPAIVQSIIVKMLGDNYFAYTNFKKGHLRTLYRSYFPTTCPEKIPDSDESIISAIDGLFMDVVTEIAKRRAEYDRRFSRCGAGTEDAVILRNEIDGLTARFEAMRKIRKDMEREINSPLNGITEALAERAAELRNAPNYTIDDHRVIVLTALEIETKAVYRRLENTHVA